MVGWTDPDQCQSLRKQNKESELERESEEEKEGGGGGGGRIGGNERSVKSFQPTRRTDRRRRKEGRTKEEESEPRPRLVASASARPPASIIQSSASDECPLQAGKMPDGQRAVDHRIRMQWAFAGCTRCWARLSVAGTLYARWRFTLVHRFTPANNLPGRETMMDHE